MFAPVEQYRGIVVWSLYGLLLIVTLMQGIGHFGVWLMPIPVAVQVANSHRRSDKLVTPIAMTLVDALIIGLGGFGWTTLLFAMGIYLVASAFGESIKRKSPILPPLALGSLVFVMLELVILAQFRTLLEAVWAKSVNVGLTHVYTVETFGLSRIWVHSLYLILPSLLCIMAVILSMLNLEIVRFLAKDSKARMNPIIAGWHMPFSMAVMYLLLLLVLLFGWGSSGLLWWKFINSAFCLASFFIGIQGISVIWRRIAGSRWRYVGISIAILFTPILGCVYTVLGLIDLFNHPQKRYG